MEHGDILMPNVLSVFFSPYAVLSQLEFGILIILQIRIDAT